VEPASFERSLNSEVPPAGGGSAYVRLTQLKGMLPAQREALGFSRYTTAVCDALRGLSEHGGHDEIVACHRNYVSLYRWVEGLWTDEGLDALIEYWRVLATTQRKVKDEHLPSLDLLWRRILLKSGTEYPLHYAGLALQGLCWSERASTVETMSSVVLTFLRWAESIQLDEDAFKQRCEEFVKGLEEAFDGTSATPPWRAFDIAALEQPESIRRYASWLIEALTEKQRPDVIVREALSMRAPNRQELNTLIGTLETAPVSDGIARVRGLYRRYVEYTWRYGDAELLGVALSRMANALLEQPAYARSNEVDTLVSEMAIELVRWQPNHQSGWALWLRALIKSEAYPGIELVLWEAIRRFSDNQIFRNQLADFQERQARYCEAEHLLRLNIEYFPKNAATYQRLAKLLARQTGRLDEAISIGNRASQLYGFRTKGLTKVLREIASRPEGQDIRSEPQIFGRDLGENLKRRPRDGMVECVALNGRALLAEFRLKCPGLEMEASAVRELQFLANEADLPFARFILARSLPNYCAPNDTSAGVFPIAFVQAIGRLDHTNWQSLLTRARSQESKWLVRVAESLLGPIAEDNEVAAWLSGERTVAGRICAVLRRRLMELIRRADSKSGVVIELVRQRGAVVTALSDAAAMMFDDEIAA
jgi:tetratricopeptide (TPR) repeat protein